MAEFLIKAQTYTHVDPVKDARGVYKIGDIVDVRPDGFEWGREECPPKFVVVKIPGLDPETVKNKMRNWEFIPDLSVESSVLATDTHSIKVVGTDFNANSGEGKVTLPKVQQYLEQWNATDIVVTDNAVTFNIKIADAIKSRQFWGLDISELTFTETNYTQAGGIHRTVIDYSGATFTPEQRDQVLSMIQRMGAYVSQDPAAKTITLDITRADVRDKFIADVKQRARHTLRRRKHAVVDALMNMAIANGGVVTVSQSEIAGYLRNKQAE